MATAKKQDKTMLFMMLGLGLMILLFIIGGIYYNSAAKKKAIKKTPVAPQAQVTQVDDSANARVAELQTQLEASNKDSTEKITALSKNVDELTQQKAQLEAKLRAAENTKDVVQVKRPSVKITYPKQQIDDGSMATVGQRKWLPTGESVLVTNTK